MLGQSTAQDSNILKLVSSKCSVCCKSISLKVHSEPIHIQTVWACKYMHNLVWVIVKEKLILGIQIFKRPWIHTLCAKACWLYWKSPLLLSLEHCTATFCCAQTPKHRTCAQLLSCKSAARFEQLQFVPWLHSSLLAAGILGDNGSACLPGHSVAFIPFSELHLTFQYPKLDYARYVMLTFTLELETKKSSMFLP